MKLRTFPLENLSHTRLTSLTDQKKLWSLLNFITHYYYRIKFDNNGVEWLVSTTQTSRVSPILSKTTQKTRRFPKIQTTKVSLQEVRNGGVSRSKDQIRKLVANRNLCSTFEDKEFGGQFKGSTRGCGGGRPLFSHRPLP